MPNSKNYALREQVIDEWLQVDDGVTARQLMKACNSELRRNGFPPVSHVNTILGDIRNMRLMRGALIEQFHVGKEVRYRYSEPGFCIYRKQITPDDIQKLLPAMDVFLRLQDAAPFEWLPETLTHIDTSMLGHTGRQQIIEYESKVSYLGRNALKVLYDAVYKHQTVRLVYQKFNVTKESVYTVFPYYLKQFAHRWYLLAGIDGSWENRLFALDRVKSVEPRFVGFREYVGEDIATVFGDMIGVSDYDVDNVSTVSLWVDSREVPWFEALPLHPSQRITERFPDHVVMTIRVRLNYELQQLLLSHAKYVRVLGPEKLRNEIRDILLFQLQDIPPTP